MKKLTMLLLAAALTLCPLFALAAQETISVYNWGDYIEPEVLDLFEQETGIKVIYETFETNEDMYAKIAMGGSSYDVIIPSDYMIERMIQENLLQKINWENIPNIANIDPRFMNEGYDPQSEYAVPYTWGTMGILYNTEMVDEAPTSWNTLMDPAYTMAKRGISPKINALSTIIFVCVFVLLIGLNLRDFRKDGRSRKKLDGVKIPY